MQQSIAMEVAINWQPQRSCMHSNEDGQHQTAPIDAGSNPDDITIF
jgi:hypothetical protein